MSTLMERGHNPDMTLPRPAESFRSASLHGNPFLYPGERPDGNFVTDGGMVQEVVVGDVREGAPEFLVKENGSTRPLDAYLEDKGVAPMAERIPVLGFGANACPGSLAKKFSKDESRPDLLVVPTMFADLPGYDVVWSGGPGMNGNHIAQLYRGEETKDTTVQVGVNFLTREQVLMMHSTEMAYELSSLEVDLGGVATTVYYYAGKDSVHIEDGAPVAIDSIQAKGRTLPTADARTMAQKTLAIDEVQAAIRTQFPDLPQDRLSEDGYLELIKSLKPKVKGDTPRTNLKKLIAATLREQGRVKVVDTAAGDTEIYSWANPSTLPTYGESMRGVRHHDVYRLPNMELPAQKWQNPTARAKVTGAIATHFYRMRGL